jgi:PleD family two-component response regulator
MRPAFDPTATLTDIGETQTREVRSLRNASPILLVDDDEEVRDHLTAVLQVAGYEVHTANSGNEALRTLHENFVPILIADRNMPDMDGLSLCRKVRTEDYPNYLYVLLLTAHDSQQDILSGLEAGADDYLSKRISPAELVARVRTAQRIVSLEQALRASLAHKRQQADTDALTGAYSRHYLNRQLTRELKRAQRYGNSLSVLLLDVDHSSRSTIATGIPRVTKFWPSSVSVFARDCLATPTGWRVTVARSSSWCCRRPISAVRTWSQKSCVARWSRRRCAPPQR